MTTFTFPSPAISLVFFISCIAMAWRAGDTHGSRPKGICNTSFIHDCVEMYIAFQVRHVPHDL